MVAEWKRSEPSTNSGNTLQRSKTGPRGVTFVGSSATIECALCLRYELRSFRDEVGILKWESGNFSKLVRRLTSPEDHMEDQRSPGVIDSYIVCSGNMASL